MAGQTDTSQLNWPRWAQALLIALLAVLIVSRLTMVLDTIGARAGLFGEVGELGVNRVFDAQAEQGFYKIVEVTPGGPFAKAGVQKGDRVRLEPVYDYLRRHRVGESVAFTLDHAGARSQHQMTVEPLPASAAAQQQNLSRLLGSLAVLVSMLIGCFILWRGWGNKIAMLVGASLVLLGYGGFLVPPWASEPWLAIPIWSLHVIGLVSTSFGIPLAMLLFEENAGPLPRWHWRLAWTWLALNLGYFLMLAVSYITLSQHLGGLATPGRSTVVWVPGFFVAIAYIAAAWRNSAAAARNRMKLMVLALGAYGLGALVLGLAAINAVTGAKLDLAFIFNALMMGLIGPGVLAYAVLRHKLFDLGFAVNRTLVFATVSAILLVSFGTIEWAVEHLVPESWHQGSAFYSAGIAVGLFLLFHRIRDGVEHFIERLFFRKWQQNEVALRRFVTAAAHVEKPEALAANFTAELARFTGGASAALYARTADGTYVSTAGEAIDADDPALAAMRAEQGPVVTAEVHSPLNAALALPMMHQAALAGFVLLGPKPSAEDYRPDEIADMAWATQQVGLDLQAIRVRDLELTNLRLTERNRTLTELVGRRTAKAEG